ncbi:MAG: hypothetical protein IJ468_02200 [Lachnospiraceae bacterium]|nr:hypothetical protein [Lachnospiraceae bacterium]
MFMIQEEIFLKLLNMSISAGWLILAVLLLQLILKNGSRAFCCRLWILVALRLILPFPLESVFSLIPSPETVSPDIMFSYAPTIDSGVPVVDAIVNPILSTSLASEPAASANPIQILSAVVSILWLAGILVLVLYGLISTIHVKKNVRTAMRQNDNIWICDTIPTAFVMGIFRPRIYLPSFLSQEDADSVIAHETMHIKRHDHWWKPFGFLLLTIYWFQPLVWIAYIRFCHDIELACDEQVIRSMDSRERKAYSEALLSCSQTHSGFPRCPLAFCETDVKKRIRSILHFRKPSAVFTAAALILFLITAACFLTDPIQATVPSRQTAASEMEALLSEPSAASYWHYAYNDSPDPISPRLLLSKQDNSFLFVYSVFQESLLSGTYEETDEQILLTDKTTGNIWLFQKHDGNTNLTISTVPAFSTPLPSYQYGTAQGAECPVPNGAVFRRISSGSPLKNQNALKASSDRLEADIDQDGVPETLTLFQFYRSGLLEFTLSASDGGKTKYQNRFSSDCYFLSLLTDEDGTVYVYGRSQSEEANVQIFQVSVKYNNLTLAEIEPGENSQITFSSLPNNILDRVIFDIDMDGTEELCELRSGRTSGVFSFELRVYEHSSLEYSKLFSSQSSLLSFAYDKNGKLQLKAESRGVNRQTSFFDFVIADGTIELIRSTDSD